VTDDQNFRGYKILGKTKIGDPTLRPEIVKAIHDGIGESDGAVALSFCPRYGVRTVTDGVPVDYMICYECSQVYVFTRGIGPRIEPTTGKYQAVLADCLTSAGIELAPGIEEKLSNSD
jgi:hypothetical protein